MAPQLKVVAHVDAVGAGKYRMEWLSGFDVVIMALDNQETRSYVNKVCRALKIYLLDAGSMGFQGQSN
jgi:ubiquitin-like 1-activating enzyme E1 B